MTVYKALQTYKKILDELQATGFSAPILVADFKAVDFELMSGAGANYELVVGVSNNPTSRPPVLTDPITPDNQYTEDIAFIDVGNGATYNGAYTSPNPYNPTSDDGGQAVSKQFRLNTNNAIWVYLRVRTYTSGTISANMTLSDNT